MTKLNKYWFRPKMYGYGFFPVSWEGWLMTFALIAVLLKFADLHGFMADTLPTDDQIFLFVWRLFITATVFAYFAEKKMKGDLGWRWGKTSLIKSLKKFFK